MRFWANRWRSTLIALSGLTVVGLAVATVGSVFANSPSTDPTYTISGNTPGFVSTAQDLGAYDPSTVISVTVWLKMHNESQLDSLVKQQNQKGSANYHKWLTQSQFNATYAPSSQEVNAVQNFLTAHNLTVANVAENNMYVEVSGTVADVQKAFHVQIDNYNVGGSPVRSNKADPSVQGSAGAHVAAITGLDDLGYHANVAFPDGASAPQMTPLTSSSNGHFFSPQCFSGVQTHTFTGTSASATYTGNRYGADISNPIGSLAPCGYQPSELRQAYSMNGLYANGLKGAGQTVVITDAFGDPTIQNDANVFSQIYNLPPLDSSNFQVIQAPGSTNNPRTRGKFGDPTGWQGEITLDVEWVHAMAPDAKIVLLIAPNNGNDLDEAINYAVVHHLGNVISNSWGAPEGISNPAKFNRVNRILEQAAAEGVDVNFSSGDSGDESVNLGYKSADFPTDSPYATSVGGTSLSLDANNNIAFQTGWGTNLTCISGKSPIASSDYCGTPANPPVSLGFQFGAGGGESRAFAKPDFQSALPGTGRLVPDVSLLADPYTGVEIIQTTGGQIGFGAIGGTSLACPMFSAMMAIATQANGGQGFGQVAPLLYSMQSGQTASTPLYDVQALGSNTNVSGSITSGSTTTTVMADQLASPLNGTTSYISAFYNSPYSTRWYVITFGTDSSLQTAPGWDNVTGVGTPNGVNFVTALTH